MKKHFTLSFLFLALLQSTFSQPYLKGRFLAKLKPSFRYELEQNSHLQNFLRQEGVLNWKKKFPLHKTPETLFNQYGEPLVDLTLIYDFEVSQSVDIQRLVKKLNSFYVFEYVELYYGQEPFYTPNDPQITSFAAQHWWLSNVQAYNAWNIQTGSPTMIIGIVDTGTDLDHPDLAPNLYLNTADPIDGIDNDADGYIDNYYGWDFVGANSSLPSPDNNPDIVPTGNKHGSWVASFAAAATDNGIGVPSAGFNCKYMPLKTMADNGGSLYFTYDAVIYAADKGCKVINCSWGSVYYSHYGQDAVNYATINKDAVVIAAAGNANADLVYYPAGFHNVVSVTGNRSGDIFSQTTRNYSVDLMAPARSIRFAGHDNTYGHFNADYTSFSAPIVSGAAALVRCQFPSLNAQQVAERLRVTSDDTYAINSNPAWTGKLGKGRLNMHRALTDVTPAIRQTSKVITDGNDNIIEDNETVHWAGYFKNFLDSDNITVTLSTTHPSVVITVNSVNLGMINTLSTVNNLSTPFVFHFNSSLPAETVIYFRLDYTNGSTYVDFQYDSIVVNPAWVNIDTNQVKITMGSTGAFGYKNFPVNSIGYGLEFLGQKLLFEGAFLLGKSTTQVSDNMRNLTYKRDEDFQMVQRFKLQKPGTISHVDGIGTMQDFKPTKLDAFVRTRTFAWNNPSDNQFIIFDYDIKNIGTSPLNNLHAGWYLDWDLSPLNQNIGIWDSSLNLLYTKNSSNTQFAGAVLLSFDSLHALSTTTPMNYAPSEANKFLAISSGTSLANTNLTTEVQQYLGTGPFNVAVNDSVIVGYALIAASSEAQLKTMAQKAHEYYRCIIHAAKAHIRFTSTNLTHTETTTFTSGCYNYHDLIIPIEIDKTPNYSADVYPQIDPATTASPFQYQIITPVIHFPANSNASQNLIVRIFDDNYDYGTKQLVISLKIKNYRDIILDCTNQKCTIHLIDNDVNPNSLPIETALNIDTRPLPPYGTAYFTADGKLLAKIENLSAHNYGCMQLQIDRTGTNALPFQHPSPNRYAAAKTFLATPEFNNPLGDYYITLYYTEPEIQGWETQTGNSRTQLTLFKSGGPISNVTPSNVLANGYTNYYATDVTKGTWNTSDFYIRGKFDTGFSGFGIGKEEPGPLPVAKLFLNGSFIKPNLLSVNWKYSGDISPDYYKLFKWSENQWINLHSFLQQNVWHIETKHFAEIIKVEAYDINGNLLAYDVQNFVFEGEKPQIYPNPADNQLFIFNPQKEKITIWNALGQEMYNSLPDISNFLNLDVSNWKSGIYLCKIGENYFKFVVE